MFWTDVVLLFAGLCVIALALILSQRLGNRPVQLGFEKLGLNLKADRLTFVLIVGVMLIGVGVYFRYQDYEYQLSSLNDQVARFTLMQKEHNGNLEMLKKELQSFKVYDLRLRIDFPQGVASENIELDVYTKKLTADAFELSSYKPVNAFGATYVKLNNLDQGEKIKIVGRDTRDGARWESISDLEIPETQIQMGKRQLNGELQ